MPRPASYAGLSPAERPIEDLARSAACPNCGAQPGRRCKSNDRAADGRRMQMFSSHLGRLLAAQVEQT